MKIRNGFVSNSSSSSFIVVFDKKPSSVEELQKLLFGDNDVYDGPYSGSWPAKEVAEVVWKDLQGQSPLTVDELAGNVGGEASENYPEYIDGIWELKDGRLRERMSSLHYAACEVEDKRVAEEFAKENEGKSIFRFEYSDNDGALSTAMEHGDLFKRLKHIKNSHH